jgi:hypothetical protein
MSKYAKSNKGYENIFTIIDVFSRKVFCYPMKRKTLKDITLAIKKFSEDAKIKKDQFIVIMSDSDSAFKGENRNEEENFQKVLENNNTVLDRIKLNDHNALGIIDNFAKHLKRILSAEFIESKSTNWIDKIDKIIENYNNTPHNSLDNITPNQALNDPEKQIHVLHLNGEKNKINKMLKPDLKEGDKVRINITRTFKKGTEPRWSDEIYIVKYQKGKSVYLENDQILKRDNILKVHDETEINNNKINVIDKSSRNKKIETQLKKEGVDENNILQSRGRTRSDNTYNLRSKKKI